MVPGLTWAMGNDNKFENNLIANRKFTQVVTTLIFLTDYGKKSFVHWSLHERGSFCHLKGNNSCKTYNFRIKVGNVEIVNWNNIKLEMFSPV